jgi:hypothetical protein
MRAVIVAVNYTDLLSVTLPWNRHHFDDVLVITDTSSCIDVHNLCWHNGCELFTTNSFYDNGALFNKWKALEQGLDYFGRQGWLCLMDADIMWPKKVHLKSYMQPGYLYTPLRYICDPIPKVLPTEEEWSRYPLHRQEREWAGYTQIFHATDPVLGPPPWHQIDWLHAGGADSFFQDKWAPQQKVRPPWKVLHLGASGKNWCGRATEYLDGTVPDKAQEKVQKVRDFIRRRGCGKGRFDHEKIK